MKYTIKVPKEVDIKTLQVKAGVRYWEDATVNDVDDETGELIPFRDGDYWCPTIDIETGHILNWPNGVVAKIHYKVCDDGEYTLFDVEGSEVVKKEGYVPEFMSPKENGYGDYIIMDIDATGLIDKWKFYLTHFIAS